MKFILTDEMGKPMVNGIHAILQRVYSNLQETSRPMENGLVWATRNHFKSIYPGSSHYNPNKVTGTGERTKGQNVGASINVDVPGITRAYHNLTIVPRFRKALTIPIHRWAFGKKASDFTNTFIVNKKDEDKAFIAQRVGGQLVYLFQLCKKAFQPKDSKLMPSDQTYANEVFSRIGIYLDNKATTT